MRAILCIILVLSGSVPVHADTATFSNRKVRQATVISGVAAAGGVSLLYLNREWYGPYNSGKFHLFDDNAEWLQMDKAGHLYTGYQSTRLLAGAFQWSGYSHRTSIIAGGAVTFAYLTAIECMDGFSRGWGYSWGDQASNLTGVAIASAQEAAWKEQRVHIKFSYYYSGVASHNPALLGGTPLSRVLKDYNAQTYWLSFNPFVVGGNKSGRCLPWLNLSVGYGAYGMLGARAEPFPFAEQTSYRFPYRERRVYLSLDVDFTQIKVRSKVLKTLFSLLNVVKIPAPALQFGCVSGAKLLIR
jgi:hypothetical protein